ncbi:hypothetical protein [Streptosporangium sp. NPDC048865]|uniref:hypothetical protein n=1 Tax=Streptosporangium sp. NPDC048865 TaxID=3155766 RepID=UPI00341D6910
MFWLLVASAPLLLLFGCVAVVGSAARTDPAPEHTILVQPSTQNPVQAHATEEPPETDNPSQPAPETTTPAIRQPLETIEDGTWVVGEDIAAGNYKVTAPVSSSCYWKIAKSGTNGDDIVENDLPGGGLPRVTLSEGQDFQSLRCGIWSKR